MVQIIFLQKYYKIKYLYQLKNILTFLMAKLKIIRGNLKQCHKIAWKI